MNAFECGNKIQKAILTLVYCMGSVGCVADINEPSLASQPASPKYKIDMQKMPVDFDTPPVVRCYSSVKKSPVLDEESRQECLDMISMCEGMRDFLNATPHKSILDDPTFSVLKSHGDFDVPNWQLILDSEQRFDQIILKSLEMDKFSEKDTRVEGFKIHKEQQDDGFNYYLANFDIGNTGQPLPVLMYQDKKISAGNHLFLTWQMVILTPDQSGPNPNFYAKVDSTSQLGVEYAFTYKDKVYFLSRPNERGAGIEMPHWSKPTNSIVTRMQCNFKNAKQDK